MTVAELIQKLSQANPLAVIQVEDGEFGVDEDIDVYTYVDPAHLSNDDSAHRVLITRYGAHEDKVQIH